MLPHRRMLVLLSVLLVLSVAFQIMNPQIIRYYIDIVTTTTGPELFTFAAILYIAIAIMRQIVLVASVYVAQNLAWSSTNSLRADIFDHSMNLDMTFHNEFRPGDMIERIDGDVNSLTNFFSQFTILVITNLLIVVGIVLALLIENIVMGSIFAVFVLFAFGGIYKTQDIAVSLWRAAREKIMKLLGSVEETLAGTEDIKANAGDASVMKKYFQHSREVYNTQMKASSKTLFFISVIYVMEALSIILVFGIGIPFVNAGIFTVGTIVMIYLYSGFLIEPIIRILRQIQELQLAGASIDRIQELFSRTSALADEGQLELPSGSLELEFKDVTFEYKEDTPVLKKLSFSVVNGRTIGLIGPTGSGKTTISRLVFRLYDPQDGSICVNDVNIKSVPISSLRSRVAMVTQAVELFQASLRDNITFFDNSIPDDRILEVIDEVGLTRWFREQPDGLDTKLQSDTGLSAGESQLLALSRVFLKNPSMVILDEASSRLDPATERLVDRAIDRLLQNRTAIIIAHRLATLDRADDIMIIENGELIEFGERRQLVKDPNSRFSQLLKTGMAEVLV